MAAVANVKTLSAFSNGIEKATVVYDFSVDAGATGVLDLATALEDLVIHKVLAKVNTTATSDGSATVEIGKSGDTAGLVAQTAVASIAAGAVLPPVAGAYKLGKNGAIQQKIATAALTAGKVTYEIYYSKF